MRKQVSFTAMSIRSLLPHPDPRREICASLQARLGSGCPTRRLAVASWGQSGELKVALLEGGRPSSA